MRFRKKFSESFYGIRAVAAGYWSVEMTLMQPWSMCAEIVLTTTFREDAAGGTVPVETAVEELDAFY